VEQTRKIVVVQPTCSYTLKREWALYVPTDDVTAVARATADVMEFVEQVRRAKGLPSTGEGLGRVAYHAACHLRAQKIGAPAARVLERALPDTEVHILEECSAVDGTWGMKADHYEEGRRYAQKLANKVTDADADLVMTDCSLSALRIERETGKPAIHPIVALARAWRLEER
jgi:glycerol-3-phosphate dehydrogenase subunit C